MLSENPVSREIEPIQRMRTDIKIRYSTSPVVGAPPGVRRSRW
jgi:hypothetical protein